MTSNFVHRLRRSARYRIGRLLRGPGTGAHPAMPTSKPVLTPREMVNEMLKTPHWEARVGFLGTYGFDSAAGVWMRNEPPTGRPSVSPRDESKRAHTRKIHYGCGGNLLDGWLNVDCFETPADNFMSLNLLERHPFPDETFEFGFCEDMVEHLTQAQSIYFLREVYRTFKPGGVFRVSFPGLEGVLDRHYSPATGAEVCRGELEAYTIWDHYHFYSFAELELVARHLGFSEVKAVEYGHPEHAELAGLDTRDSQIGLNLYAELTR